MIERKPHNWRRKGLLVLSGFVAIGLLSAYIGVSAWIGTDVRRISGDAMQRYEGDAVEALMEQVGDSARPLADRNEAVWALGQMGDSRALQVLQHYSTGGPCHHETALCERELAKAIKHLEGGLNVTALVWR